MRVSKTIRFSSSRRRHQSARCSRWAPPAKMRVTATRQLGSGFNPGRELCSSYHALFSQYITGDERLSALRRALASPEAD